jgi:putative sterol carrier protein
MGGYPMDLNEITSTMRAKVGADCGIAKVIKFDFGDEGLIRIDGTANPNSVDNEDGDADCTIRVSLADFVEIASGRQNPQMAFMMGKLKVEGDMGIAMQLGQLLG